jgi:FeS assembly SUF system protein
MAQEESNQETCNPPAAAAVATPGAMAAAPAAESGPAAPAESGPAADAPEANAQATGLEDGIVEALKTVYDPEIPVNIYEMGLIYDLNVEPDGRVQIKMTLTSPGCPVAGSLPGEVKDKVESVPGVAGAEVEVVWDPVWNPSMMSEAARLQLGMF